MVVVVMESGMADGRVSGKLPPKVACKEGTTVEEFMEQGR